MKAVFYFCENQRPAFHGIQYMTRQRRKAMEEDEVRGSYRPFGKKQEDNHQGPSIL